MVARRCRARKDFILFAMMALSQLRSSSKTWSWCTEMRQLQACCLGYICMGLIHTPTKPWLPTSKALLPYWLPAVPEITTTVLKAGMLPTESGSGSQYLYNYRGSSSRSSTWSCISSRWFYPSKVKCRYILRSNPDHEFPEFPQGLYPCRTQHLQPFVTLSSLLLYNVPAHRNEAPSSAISAVAAVSCYMCSHLISCCHCNLTGSAPGSVLDTGDHSPGRLMDQLLTLNPARLTLMQAAYRAPCDEAPHQPALLLWTRLERFTQSSQATNSLP